MNLDGGKSNNEHESLGVTASSVGHEDTGLAVDDTFLIVQRSSLIESRICNGLFDKPKTEFLAELSGACDVAELRFVRDIIYSTVKRRTASGHLGPLVERKSGDSKEKLLKDVYNLYLFGEGTITSLPNDMLKTDTEFVSQGIQTDTVTCQGGTLFATKAEVENLKAEILDRISALQQTLLPDSNQRNSSNPSAIISLPQQTQPSPSENPVCPVTPSSLLPLPSVHNVSIHELPQSSQMQFKPEK